VRNNSFQIRRLRQAGVKANLSVSLIDARPNDVIYRTFTIERFLQVLQERKLFLVKPNMWSDPFENILRNTDVPILRGFAITLDRHYDEFYGQCWCYGRENGATWRLYAPGAKRGVRARSSIGVLAGALCSAGAGVRANSLYIGKVKYLPVRRIQQLLSNPEISGDIQQKVLRAIFQGTDAFDRIPNPKGTVSALTLFVKRPEFSHEREVRIVYREHDRSRIVECVRAFSVDPNELVHSVLVDPRSSLDEFRRVARDFVEAGYRGAVRQSTLYRIPGFRLHWSQTGVRVTKKRG
jgi:hypothetical protein